MIVVLLGLAVGYLGARVSWVVLGPVFGHPTLLRSNYRAQTLPTSVGILLAVVAVVVEAIRTVAGSFGVGNGPGLGSGRGLILLTVAGFGLLGLLDDLLGDDDARGFRGHARALLAGRLTTGALKVVGGGALALVVVGPVVGESPGRLVVDALLVALAANAANLLDRAPGRTTKVSALAFVLVVVGTAGAAGLAPVAVVVGAALGLLPAEMHERLMLGDAGANALGAAIGLGVVLTCGTLGRDVALVIVVLLNVAGELVSLGRVIDATPGLRAADRAGRRR